MTSRLLRDQSGFSLVELMVAALILIIGASSAFALIDGANKSVTSNSARLGGSNLARELTEYARATDYDSLAPGQIVPALRARPTIAGSLSGGAWTVERRGVTYTITTKACTFDDPKDGLAATPPANPCPAATSVNTKVDANPDDFRKVTFTLSWSKRGRSGTATQSALIVNPSGGLGPRIVNFQEPGTDLKTDQGWGSGWSLELKSEPANAVHWSVDDGKSGGDAAGGTTLWGFTWGLGTAFDPSNSWVRDGAYTMQAQAFDSRGVPGEAKIITVYVNRHAPRAPGNFTAGFNPRYGTVDMHWDRYGERDLQGYQVVRESDGKQICPVAAGEGQAGLSCTDPDPPLGSTEKYSLYALDCENLALRLNCLHRGDPATVTVTTTSSGDAPEVPTGLTAQVIDSLPQLNWTAPSAGATPLFYRIYRDQGPDSATGWQNRYDETITATPQYTDPNPGSTTSHAYWVTAVDANFQESAAVGPVQSPPVALP